MHRLKNKVAVIAGGAGGIGTATSLRLAEEGARVVVGDIDIAAAEAVVETITKTGGTATPCRVDLGDQGSIAALFAHAVEAHGGVDLLHCNAAAINLMTQDTDALAIDMDVWEGVLAVNLTGYLHCTRSAIPLMIERGGGSIVYTSSGAAFTGEAERIAYAVAKSGINALMRHVARRWGKQGVRCNSIAPGMVQTPAVEALVELKQRLLEVTPGPRLGVPDDIASMVAMLMSDDAEWITGQVISVDGGLSMR